MLRYVLAILLLSPLATIAQKPTFGILGGTTLSGYTSSEIFQNSTPLVGTSLGVYRGVPLTESLDIEPGFYLSQRGIRYQSISSPAVGRNRLMYLVLPVLLRKQLINNFSLHIGPYVASFIYGNYRSSGSVRTEDWNTWGLFDRDRNIPDAQFDIGLQAGLRYVSPSHFVINASYEHGAVRYLQSVISDGPFAQTVTVSVGYQW